MTNHLLIAARKASGKLQIDIAEEIGVTKSTLNRWEQEKTVPHPYHRRKLCAFFGKTEQELGLLCSKSLEELQQPLTSFDPFVPLSPESSLIGRDTELAQLKTRLIQGNTVTLTALNGLPGVGKTALAIALAHDDKIRTHFKDGILWAGLGPNPDLRHHLSRWGTLLDLSLEEMSSLNDPDAWAMALRQKIGSRTMLLVIDDAWTLEDTLAFQVGGPQCSHLVTTRFPGIATHSTVPLKIDELTNDEGLALLSELAPLVVAQEKERASELVRVVGGLPLALHLMGNHLRKQSSTQQTRRISAALQRLSDAHERLSLCEQRTPLERHPCLHSKTPLSLHAVIDVTVQQLDAQSRSALFALSVFPPKPETFSEAAALAVAVCTEETLDVLADAGILESSNGSRYMLHQTIADYARLHLETDTTTDAHARLIAYLTTYVQIHHANYHLLEAEIAVIFATLDIAYQSEQPNHLLQSVKHLVPFLIHRGLCRGIERYLRRAYDIAKTHQDTANGMEVAQYLEQFAQVLIKLGAYDQARTYLNEGIVVARHLDAPESISLLLKRLGVVTYLTGDFPLAKTYYLEGLAIGRTLQNLELIIPHLINVGIVVDSLGDHEQAAQFSQEALTLARSINHTTWVNLALNNLIGALEELGDYAQAETYLQEGLESARQSNHAEGIYTMLENHARLAERQGNYVQAFADRQEALTIAHQLGDPWHITYTLLGLGANAERCGNYAQAAAYFQENSARTGKQERRLGWLSYYLSHLAIKQGNYAQAMHYAHEGIASLAHSPQDFAQHHLAHLLMYQALVTVLQGQTLSPENVTGMHQALTLVEEANDPIVTISILGIQGEIEAIQGNVEAEIPLQRAVALADQFHLPQQESYLWCLLGERAIQRGDTAQAETELHTAWQIAREQTIPEYMGRVHNARGELFLVKRQLDAADTAFQESLRAMPEAHPLLHAQALFGQARVAAEKGEEGTARKHGQQAHHILESIGHYQATEVQTWLAVLQPRTAPAFQSTVVLHASSFRRQMFFHHPTMDH